MGGTSEALFSPVCLDTNSVLCLRSNLSSRELTTLSQNRKTLEPVFIPRMSPCRHSVLMRSPRHTLSVCFNPVKTARHGKPPSDCVSCSATAKLGRQTLTPGNLNFQRQQVEKSLFAVFAAENGAKCDLFVEKMRATKVNMHQCLFGIFFLRLWSRNCMFCCTELLLILFARICAVFNANVPRPFLRLMDSACGS